MSCVFSSSETKTKATQRRSYQLELLKPTFLFFPEDLAARTYPGQLRRVEGGGEVFGWS